MNKQLLLGAVILFSSVVQAEDIIIDIPALVGKSKGEVVKLIGKPTSCVNSKYGEKCQFDKGETEIVFIKGKADWFTVEGLDAQPFADTTILQLGFMPQKSSSSNDFTITWEPIQGLISVSLFKGSDNSDYAYIKAFTN